MPGCVKLYAYLVRCFMGLPYEAFGAFLDLHVDGTILLVLAVIIWQVKKFNFAIHYFQKYIDLLPLAVYTPGPQVLNHRP